MKSDEQDFGDLPDYLPEIEASPGYRFTGLPVRPYVLPMDEAVTEVHMTKRDWIRERLELPDGMPLLLSGHGTDELIHRTWEKDLTAAFAERNWWEGFSSVFTHAISPDFSVWRDAPRAEHLVEMKRSLVTMRRMQDAGLLAFPSVFWHSDVNSPDLKRWADWLNDNDALGAFAVNIQLPVKQKAFWRQHRHVLCRELTELRAHLGSSPWLILIGVSQPEDVELLATSGFKLKIVNGRAYHEARSGKELRLVGGELRTAKQPDNGKLELFERNLTLLDAVYNQALHHHRSDEQPRSA